jgi:hypothetical protein
MGIFEDIRAARKAIEEQGMRPRIYVLSPREYELECDLQDERVLGIIRRPVAESLATRRARRA